MADKGITRMNPDGVTYRVPLQLAGEFRVVYELHNQGIFGDMVNRLGQYESCLSLSEAREYKENKK